MADVPHHFLEASQAVSQRASQAVVLKVHLATTAARKKAHHSVTTTRAAQAKIAANLRHLPVGRRKAILVTETNRLIPLERRPARDLSLTSRKVRRL